MNPSISIPIQYDFASSIQTILSSAYQKVANFFSQYFTRKTPNAPEQPEGKLEKGLSHKARIQLKSMETSVRAAVYEANKARMIDGRNRGYY